MKVYATLLLLAGALTTALPVPAASLETQRRDFLAARSAFAQGDHGRYQRLTQGLRDYPLYPYLRYEELKPRIGSASPQEIRDFIDRYDGSLPADRLRAQWLLRLAGQRAWTQYLADYREFDDAGLRCHHAQALLSTGAVEEARQETQALWLVGNSQPSACDAVFEWLTGSPQTGSELIRDRIRLAMEEGQLQLAGALARRLSQSDQDWVAAWQRMYTAPARELQSARYQQANNAWANTIVSSGVRRLARNEPELAMQRWQALKPRLSLTGLEIAALERDIAAAAARKDSPQAITWLDRVDPAVTDAEFNQLRVRTAVLRQDWNALQRWAAVLPARQQSEMTNYWMGRALMQKGQTAAARDWFGKAAAERSYYGFLAADHLDQLYAFNHQPIRYTPAELEAMAKRPALRRCEEFYRLHLVTEARREWRHLTRNMDSAELQLVAVLADRWGWYERAIATLGQAKAYDDLEVRFPVPHRDQIVTEARRQKLDPSWMYGLMRQESAFMTDARSSAGALGLMQLMPATAQYTAKLLNLPPHNDKALLSPAYNIQLGSGYLRYVLNKFGGNPVLATAAYNAGPGRVRQWRPNSAAMPVDLWVESIPFNETRKYVQNVMSYSVLFDYRLQRPIQTLSQRMPATVPPQP